MVCFYISRNSPGPIEFVDGYIDGVKYVKTLEDHSVPYLDTLPLSKWVNTVYQQDNARPQSSQYTKTALRNMSITVSSWPSLSPDLNIIENMWAILKRRVRKHHATSIQALRRAIEEEWAKTATKRLGEKLFDGIKFHLVRVCTRKAFW